jgi:hypothetical protein
MPSRRFISSRHQFRSAILEYLRLWLSPRNKTVYSEKSPSFVYDESILQPSFRRSFLTSRMVANTSFDFSSYHFSNTGAIFNPVSFFLSNSSVFRVSSKMIKLCMCDFNSKICLTIPPPKRLLNFLI